MVLALFGKYGDPAFVAGKQIAENWNTQKMGVLTTCQYVAGDETVEATCMDAEIVISDMSALSVAMSKLKEIENKKGRHPTFVICINDGPVGLRKKVEASQREALEWLHKLHNMALVMSSAGAVKTLTWFFEQQKHNSPSRSTGK